MKRKNLVPAAVLVAGLIIVAGLSTVANNSKRLQLALEANVQAMHLKRHMESCLGSRIAVVNTLAHYDWTDQQQLLQDWTTRSNRLLALYPGIQALNYVDTNWVISKVNPLPGNEAALGQDLHDNPNPSVVASMTAAQETGELTRTDSIPLLQSGTGLVFYKAITSQAGQRLGYVDGVFRIDDLVAACLQHDIHRESFDFSLSETQGAPVYRQQVGDEAPDHLQQVILQLDVAGRPWQLGLTPTTQHQASHNWQYQQAWPLLGALLVLALSYATRSLLIKQDNLQASQDKYKLLVENQADMLVKVDKNGRFLYVSPSYCTAFGKSEAELLQHNFMPLVHEDDRELTTKSLATLARPPHSSYHEQRAYTKDGWRWIAWSNTAVIGNDGEVEAITAIGRDVTDLKSLEDRMAHSQKMQIIGEMAGGISHDFNNLLQVMLSNVEFAIMKAGDDKPVYKPLEQIQKMIERAMSLVEKLSNTSHQQAAQFTRVDLAKFVPEVTALLQRSLPGSLNLALDNSAPTLPMEADETQLEQVILNLCFNARDALAGAGLIHISLSSKNLDENFCRSHREIDPGEFACLRITDNGPGIAPEILPRIFDPFFTTKQTQTGTGGGLGLGLANSYNIIRQHRGLIVAESQPGAGTTFTIYLPLADASIQLPKASPREVQPEVAAGQATGVILAADDNQPLLDLISINLDSAGYDVLTASNGKDAVDLFTLHRDKVDLVILDLVMPVMNGKTAAEQILALSPNTKFVFISGFVPEAIASIDTLPGPLVRKPFTRDELQQKITEVLAS